MRSSHSEDFEETRLLQGCASAAERQKLLADFFMLYRDRLKLLVELRMDSRLQGRFDPSDVVQEAYLDIAARLEEYLRRPALPFFLWLRRLTGQKLAKLQIHHLRSKKRSVRKEVYLDRDPVPEATTAAFVARLLDRGSSPSEASMRREERGRVEKAIGDMDPADREILALRCFEGLNSAEAARVLGIGEEAARKRYFRALKRLREIIGARD